MSWNGSGYAELRTGALASRGRMVMTLAAIMLLAGCTRQGVDPERLAAWRDEYQVQGDEQDALTLAELLVKLDSAAASTVTADTDDGIEASTASAQSAVPADTTTTLDAAEPSDTELPGQLVLVQARLASAAPDLTAAIPAFPWDDVGSSFYVTDIGHHDHVGHDADCPFCARREAAGGAAQLVKVELIDRQTGSVWQGDLRPFLQLKPGDPILIEAHPQLRPGGLVVLQARGLSRPSGMAKMSPAAAE